MSLGAASTTALVVLGVSWLALAVRLVVDLVSRRPKGMRFRLMWGGMMLMLTGGLLSQFAVVRQWPPSRSLVIDSITLMFGIAGVACGAVGIASRRRSQSPRT
jgi:hypothetical protein